MGARAVTPDGVLEFHCRPPLTHACEGVGIRETARNGPSKAPSHASVERGGVESEDGRAQPARTPVRVRRLEGREVDR
jgi:hypothetical protein